MKHFFNLFIALLLAGVSFSQNSNLIIFNNSGQQFFVILNGIKQNSIPKTNLKIEGLIPASYEVKLIFADGKTRDINKKIWLEPNMQFTARVDLKKPKKGKLRLFDYVNLREVNPNQQATETVVYRPNDASIYSDQQVKPVQNTNQNYGTHTHSDGTVHDVNHNIVKPNQTGTHTHADGTVHDQNHNVVINTTTSPTGVSVGTTHTNSNGTVHDQNHNVQINTTTSPTGVNIGMTHTNSNGTVHDQNHNVVINTTTSPTGVNIGMTHTNSNGTVHDQNHNVQINTTTSPTGVNIGMTHTNSNGTVHDQNHHVQISTTTSPTGVSIGTSHSHAAGTIHDANHHVVIESQVTPNGIHMGGGTTHTHADGTVHDQDHNTIIDGDFMDDDHEDDEAIFNEKPPRCYTPIASVDAILKEVNEKSFSSDKMNVVTKNLRQQCINSDQAYRIVNAFTFEGDRLKIAKFLYNRMTDKQNAKKILELFTFESTKEEYKIFIQ